MSCSVCGINLQGRPFLVCGSALCKRELALAWKARVAAHVDVDANVVNVVVDQPQPIVQVAHTDDGGGSGGDGPREPFEGGDWLSRRPCQFGRYAPPPGLRLVGPGTFLVDELVRVWGSDYGLSSADVLDTVQTHMCHKDKTSRFVVGRIGCKLTGKITIRVMPKRRKALPRSAYAKAKRAARLA